MSTSAAGEQAALGGYKWQYDQIAKLIYEALVEGELDSFRLTDPEAGKVDDLVLVRDGRTDAYQFRSGEGTVTFRSVTRAQKARGGSEVAPLIRSFADAWRKLGGPNDRVHIHYFAEMPASTHDRIVPAEVEDRPTHNHFKGFLTEVLEQLRLGRKSRDEIDESWRATLDAMLVQSGVGSQDSPEFLRSLHFDLNARPGIDTPIPSQRADLIELSNRLYRLASEIDGVVELDTEQLLQLMGWQDRTRFHSTHRFPIDLATYEPLSDAMAEVRELLEQKDRGYIAVVGPPGTGKSTLLTQTMLNTSARVVRYYAYVPETGEARNRLTGRSFLHDVVLKLKESGLKGHHQELTSDDPTELRRQLAELFDSAHKEFSERGRRTIIIVDGLDHVEREYSGDEGLLSELPKIQELPKGVMLVVGTRMLNPLGPDVRQHLQESDAVVDLTKHPLPPPVVRDICRRAPGVASLGEQVHQLIVERSAGHPLTLSYLLSRVRDMQVDAALTILESTPEYSGDIFATYQAVWDDVAWDDALVRIFSVCARLRVGFRTPWLERILGDLPLGREKVQRFIRDFRYLFRIENNEWRFFHDSFRQFANERTALGPIGMLDPQAEASAHRDVADICAETDDFQLASEELYHRHLAQQDDDVLALARQAIWRHQIQNSRSSSLIHSDIELALQVAADRGDVLAMLRAILGLAELRSRLSVFESFDLPKAFYEAGLVAEAIQWCSGRNPAVLLAHRFHLAGLLGRDGIAAGRRLFDSNEHLGLDEPNGDRIAGQLHDAAIAWVQAAALFRPIASVLQRIESVIEEGEDSLQGQNPLPEDEYWSRYFLMLRGLIDSTRRAGDSSGLEAIDVALQQRLASLVSNEGMRSNKLEDTKARRPQRQRIASIVALRVEVAIAICALVPDPIPVARLFASWLTETASLPAFHYTRLDAAELLADLDLAEEAQIMLDRIPYESAITASDLAYDFTDDSTVDKFRYWRLRYRLAADASEVPDSTPPAPQTPAGNDIPENAPRHRDAEAIKFAQRIDDLTRELARIDAATQTREKETIERVWSIVRQAVDVVPANRSRRSLSLSGYPLRAPGILETAAEVVARFGEGLPQRLSDELGDRFLEHPEGWLATPLLNVLTRLRTAGVEVGWEREVLAAHEANAAEESVHMKTEQMAELIPSYRSAGYPEKAVELARQLPRVAFAVGFRKDHQFDEWVSWYADATSVPGESQFLPDGSWLARLLNAADRMTEGLPGRAAIELPSAIAPVDPFAAVRVFEYLVRNGTVPHFSALAAIIRELIHQIDRGEIKTIILASDITAHLISAGANRAYPELAARVVTAQRDAIGVKEAQKCAKSIADRTDRFALPTTRKEWRVGLRLELGDEPTQEDSRYYDLSLRDGHAIPMSEALAQIKTGEDVLSKRQEESAESGFPWEQAVKQLDLPSDLVKTLAPLFRGSDQRDLDVQVVLAEAAEVNGNREFGLSLANDALLAARGNSWAGYLGGTRLRCGAIRVRLGDSQERIRVCQDLARNIVGNPDLIRTLIYDLREVVRSLAPELTGDASWPLVRDYLAGMAEPLEFGSDDPFEDHGSRWWSAVSSVDRRQPNATSSASGAVAELVVRHLSHPYWVVSDAAVAIVAQALGRGDEDVAQALARFVELETSHDLLEQSARCLASARNRFGIEIPRCLESLDHTLATHPSQVLRDLASQSPRRANRALEPAYELVIAGGSLSPESQNSVGDDPYHTAYRVLADVSGIEESAVVRVAARHAEEESRNLPSDSEIQSALKSAGVSHRYTPPEFAARRAAYGRVLADFRDSGALNATPIAIRRMLRTVDLDLVGATPESCPDAFPSAPPAGHEQTAKRWMDDTDERLQDYVLSSVTGHRTLIGARVDLGVLNWGHLEEEFLCGTAIGVGFQHDDGPLFEPRSSMLISDLTVPSVPREIHIGDPLVIENSPFRFQQLQAHWLAFRPDFATALGWTPEKSRPGTWYTASGAAAVESVWWVDGWWSHTGRNFEDTVAMGHAVLLSKEGKRALNAAFGPTSRHFQLTRTAHEHGEEHGPRVAGCEAVLQ